MSEIIQKNEFYGKLMEILDLAYRQELAGKYPEAKGFLKFGKLDGNLNVSNEGLTQFIGPLKGEMMFTIFLSNPEIQFVIRIDKSVEMILKDNVNSFRLLLNKDYVQLEHQGLYVHHRIIQCFITVV